MEELDYWRLCEELNIVQAALLVVGEVDFPAFTRHFLASKNNLLHT